MAISVIKARYSGCNDGKEVIRISIPRITATGTINQEGLLLRATDKSLIVAVDEYTKVVFFRKDGTLNKSKTKISMETEPLDMPSIEEVIATVFGSNTFDSGFVLKSEDISIPDVDEMTLAHWAASLGCSVYDVAKLH